MNNTNNNYISLDVIANKIYKNPLLKDVNYEDIIDFSLSVIKIAKVKGTYSEESCYKEITDHKTVLPKSALNLKTVDLVVGKRLFPMKLSTYSLNNHRGKIDNEIQERENNSTYSVNNNMIITSNKSGRIFITFDTINQDENGIPMIPDSESLIRAIEAYIKIQVFTVMVDMGKMGERSLARAEQEYYFNIGKYQSEQQGFKNEDEMESFLNGWKRTFPSSNEHSNRYEVESMKEKVRRL